MLTGNFVSYTIFIIGLIHNLCKTIFNFKCYKNVAISLFTCVSIPSLVKLLKQSMQISNVDK